MHPLQSGSSGFIQLSYWSWYPFSLKHNWHFTWGLRVSAPDALLGETVTCVFPLNDALSAILHFSMQGVTRNAGQCLSACSHEGCFIVRSLLGGFWWFYSCPNPIWMLMIRGSRPCLNPSGWSGPSLPSGVFYSGQNTLSNSLVQKLVH